MTYLSYFGFNTTRRFPTRAAFQPIGQFLIRGQRRKTSQSTRPSSPGIDATINLTSTQLGPTRLPRKSVYVALHEPKTQKNPHFCRQVYLQVGQIVQLGPFAEGDR